MNGTEQVQWLMVGFAAVMCVIGLWMKHDADKLDRRIEEDERRRADRNLHPAE